MGFCIGSIFLLIGVIFQLCVLRSKLLPMLEEDENQKLLMKKANTKMFQLTVGVMEVNMGLFAFLFPLAIFSQGGNTGLNFGIWIGYGLVFAGITLVAVYAIYVFCMRERIAKKETFYMEEAYWAWMKADKQLLRKALKMALTVAVVLGMISGVIYNIDPAVFVKPIVFETVKEFQLYMEENVDSYYSDGWDGVPIEVYLKKDWNRVLYIRDRISRAFGILIVIEFVGFAILYIRRTTRNLPNFF